MTAPQRDAPEMIMASSQPHTNGVYNNINVQGGQRYFRMTQYIRADLARAQNQEAALHYLAGEGQAADALDAVIAALVEALRERDGGAHDVDCKFVRDRGRRACTCGHVKANAAIAKAAALK